MAALSRCRYLVVRLVPSCQLTVGGQIWLTEAYFDQHIVKMGYLYDLEAAAEWTGYVRGRFGTDVA